MEVVPPSAVVISVPHAPAEAPRSGVLQRILDRVVGLFSVCRLKYRFLTKSDPYRE